MADDDVYDITVSEFDEVCQFRLPEQRLPAAESQLRMYDAEAETYVYAMQSSDGLSIDVHDASAPADGAADASDQASASADDA